MASEVFIVSYEDGRHREEVIALWENVFAYTTEHSAPALSIDKKLAADDGLFFVAEKDAKVAGTVMCGYDGHRGWIYSLAVWPSHQGAGIGRALMAHAEEALAETGCVKINLQMLEKNRQVEGFYQKLGYVTERRISMGKKLVENVRKGGEK